MILIKNTQRKIKVDIDALKKDAQIMLNDLGYHDFDLGIWLTTNPTIRHYNKEYRNKDKATDILSFSYYPEVRPGETIIPHSEEEKNLGDLIISVEFVQKAAQELRTTLKKRMRILLIHGICHLRGYDHELDEDYEVMKQEEDRLLALLNTTST